MILSKVQKEIVESKCNNIIVDAAAGSGKTRTLTERVKKLLNSGSDPNSIVVITFTNLAADELHDRLSDVPGSNKCFIGTIHSYANKLLKNSGKQFEIFSEYYQTQFMKILIPKYAHYCTEQDYLLFMKYEKMVSLGRMSKSEIPSKFSDYKVYEELLFLLGKQQNYMYPETVLTLSKINNIISFDELLELTTDYFRKTSIDLEYLFVDELQDIGYLEYNFLIGLKAKNNFFIGDDYQAIYGFKGGDVNIFLSLMKNDSWKSYYLSDNYRTAKSILMYANAVIEKATNIIKKSVIPKNENKGELQFIVKSQLESFLSHLKEDEDWLLLTRTNKEMMLLDSILNKNNKEHYCFKQSNIPLSKLKKIKEKPCIKIMTVHSAKGLEAENVAIYGKFPIKNMDDSDELKVFYVGITRSINKCVIFI